jgi:hypothetical protein
LTLSDEAKRFFVKVDFDHAGSGEARRLLPARRASPVVFDPLVRFGRP